MSVLLTDLGRKGRLLASGALLVCMAFTIMVFFYEDTYFVRPKRPETLIDVLVPSDDSKYRRVLLPAGFQFPEKTLQAYLNGTSSRLWPTLQLEHSELISKAQLERGNLKRSVFNLYSLSNGDDCQGTEQKSYFATDKSEVLGMNLTKIFEIFNEEAIHYGNTFNQHLLPILEKYMEKDMHEKHWFRFSGSSVWLKDYNVHLMVSRFELSENGIRDNARVSMILGQVYDQDWKEVQDVRLVLPSNSVEEAPGFSVYDQSFISYRFPAILPFPFMLGWGGYYWGAEDPRIISVKNKFGREEPVVIFNSFHLRNVVTEDQVETQGFRSIFLSYPFQVQKGKQLHGEDNDGWYTRTNHIHIKDEEAKKTEKNWTPFLSGHDDYDSHVMFATSLDPLKIIKCELWTGNSDCEVQESQGDNVGALRGGTPLIRIKTLAEEDKEIFIGFARAHLSGCGCGGSFYRPNLVVLARKGTRWRLTHVSSFVDLGMEILPWADDVELCEGVNAMIPNGIESYDLERDLLTLQVSVSDFTVERVAVHGILSALEENKVWEVDETDDMVSPVACALESSKVFCKEYGEKHSNRRRSLFEIFFS